MNTQRQWNWCRKCQGFFFMGNTPDLGVCPKDKSWHDAIQSGDYAAPWGEDAPGFEGNWRWCWKCQGMFFAGNVGPSNSNVCPMDLQSHDDSHGSHYYAMELDSGANGAQSGWRRCRKCQVMFFAGNPDQGACPFDNGPHDEDLSPHYAMHWDSGTSSDVNRLVTIWVDATTTNVTAVAHGVTGFSGVQALRLGPGHQRDRVEFSGSGTPRGDISFEVQFNSDLSITASWTAQEIDDEVESVVPFSETIVQDDTLSWSGLRTANPDPIDRDWTDYGFAILNKVDSD